MYSCEPERWVNVHWDRWIDVSRAHGPRSGTRPSVSPSAPTTDAPRKVGAATLGFRARACTRLDETEILKKSHRTHVVGYKGSNICAWLHQGDKRLILRMRAVGRPSLHIRRAECRGWPSWSPSRLVDLHYGPGSRQPTSGDPSWLAAVCGPRGDVDGHKTLTDGHKTLLGGPGGKGCDYSRLIEVFSISAVQDYSRFE